MGFDTEIVGVYFRLQKIARCYYRDERAQDLASETVARALEARSRYDSRYPLLAWCRAIMRNLWRNAVQKLSTTCTQRLGEWDEPGGEEADQRARVNEILAIVSGMAKRSVAVATLLDAAKGLSMGEIATARGIPEGTVKRRIHDARKMLAALINVKQTST